MNAGILAGVALAAFLFLGRKKPKNIDPRGAINAASNLTTPTAMAERLNNDIGRLMNNVGVNRVVLSPPQIQRLQDAAFRKNRYLGMTPIGTEQMFYDENAYRTYIERALKKPSFATFNEDLAKKLAPKVAEHLREFRGWYVTELIQDFQVACGLVDKNGQPSGRYGGQTMGALCYFMFTIKNKDCDYDQIPSPIHDPKWQVTYRKPRGEQVS